MDYIHCIAQAVSWRSAATRYEQGRKMGLCYEAQSCTGFAWVPQMSLWPDLLWWPKKWGGGCLPKCQRAD